MFDQRHEKKMLGFISCPQLQITSVCRSSVLTLAPQPVYQRCAPRHIHTLHQTPTSSSSSSSQQRPTDEPTMGKINGCLKCLFIFFNMLFAVLGCVLIYGAVSLTSYSRQLSVISGSSVGWSWVFAIGVLCISCLGIYAGFSEKELALKIFAGFMGVGMLIMLIFGIIVVVSRNKLRSGFDEGSSEVATAIMANEDLRTLLEAMQTGGCCGVVSASDWGSNIPESCKCRPGQTAFGGFSAGTCRSKPQGAAGPDRIFAQSCGDIIFMWFDFFFKFAMGLFFGFAVTALLGLLISLLMIHQIRRHDGAGGASIAMKGY